MLKVPYSLASWSGIKRLVSLVFEGSIKACNILYINNYYSSHKEPTAILEARLSRETKEMQNKTYNVYKGEKQTKKKKKEQKILQTSSCLAFKAATLVLLFLSVYPPLFIYLCLSVCLSSPLPPPPLSPLSSRLSLSLSLSRSGLHSDNFLTYPLEICYGLGRKRDVF